MRVLTLILWCCAFVTSDSIDPPGTPFTDNEPVFSCSIVQLASLGNESSITLGCETSGMYFGLVGDTSQIEKALQQTGKVRITVLESALKGDVIEINQNTFKNITSLNAVIRHVGTSKLIVVVVQGYTQGNKRVQLGMTPDKVYDAFAGKNHPSLAKTFAKCSGGRFKIQTSVLFKEMSQDFDICEYPGHAKLASASTQTSFYAMGQVNQLSCPNGYITAPYKRWCPTVYQFFYYRPAQRKYGNFQVPADMYYSPPKHTGCGCWVDATGALRYNWFDSKMEPGGRLLCFKENRTPLPPSDHYMFILPNEGCVNWRGAAAWGNIGGPFTWIPYEHVANEQVTIHEFGHNLGFNHATDRISRSSYGDGTDWMGNIGWHDKKMCFNSANMWRFGWYNRWGKTIRPTTTEKNISLRSLAQVQYLEANKISPQNDDKAYILHIKSHYKDPQYKNSDNIYVGLNAAQGPNSGVTQYKNMVTVHRCCFNGATQRLAALKSDDVYEGLGVKIRVIKIGRKDGFVFAIIAVQSSGLVKPLRYHEEQKEEEDLELSAGIHLVPCMLNSIITIMLVALVCILD